MNTVSNFKNASFGWHGDDLNASIPDSKIHALIDHIKSVGFDGITFDYSIKVNTETGEVSSPDITRMWSLIDYAKKQGLDVQLKTHIGPGFENLNLWTLVGKNFSYDTLFKTLLSPMQSIAASAQQHGVSVFYVGSENNSFDTAAYHDQWKTIVDSIRNVFTGVVTYDALYLDWLNKYSPDGGPHKNDYGVTGIWDLFDAAALSFYPQLSSTPIYNLDEIKSLYFYRDGVTNYSAVNDVINFANSINKPVFFGETAFNATDKALLMYASELQLAQDNIPTNYSLQALGWQSLLEILANNLSEFVKGINIYEYNVWTSMDWIQHPVDATGKQFYTGYVLNSSNLNSHPIAEQVISQYLNKPWDYHTTNTTNGGPKNDIIYVVSGNNIITGGAGNDDIHGGTGIDTSLYSGAKSNYTITNTSTGFIIQDNVGTDGTDILTNIQRLQFSDASIAYNMNGNAGTTAKIIGAVFGKEYLSNKQYVGFCLHLLDGGTSNSDLASIVLNAAHLTTNDEIVSNLEKNVLGTSASAADKTSLLDLLNKGTSPSDLVLMQANTPANISNINLDGLALTGIQYTDYENHIPTGAVTITGTPTQGQILTVSNNLADLEGLGKISYQWQANGLNITDATNSTLVLDQTLVEKAISVVARYIDGFGTAENVSSAVTSNVANVNEKPTGNAIITGTATQNQTLTASNTLADADGLGAITYQWLRDGNVISNATQSTYSLTQTEVSKKISVKANYVDGFGAENFRLVVAST